MRNLIILLSALVLTTLGLTATPQNKKNADDYNLKKAYEVLNEDGDEEKALELTNKQLEQTPDNVDALILKTRLLRYKKELGAAFRTINHAIEVNKPKKSGVPNSALYWWKAFIYNDLHDYDNASVWFKKAYDLSRKDDKANRNSIAFDYAQCLYHQKKPEAADAIYNTMLKEDESALGAMIGLSRNMINRGEYDQALTLLDKCGKMDPDYSEVYHFKMRAYDKTGEAAKAIDAALDWYEKAKETDTGAILRVLKKRPNYAETSIRSRIKSAEDHFIWKAFLCQFYDDSYRYAEAIKAYDDLEEEYGHYDAINIFRSECYSKLGLFDRAIADISIPIEKEQDGENLIRRADYYRLSGRLDEAIKDLNAAIEDIPGLSFTYYRRGWVYEMKGDSKKAMEDYNMGIELDDDYPYLYLMRGELLLQQGKKAEARADFEQVIQRDTVANGGSCRQYALHFLGRDDEALEWMDKIIAEDPDDRGNYYDQACLYSRMGRLKESVEALRVAFEKGFRSFAHIRLDDDMDPVRKLPEFKALIKEYETKHKEYLKQFDLTSGRKEEMVTEIAIRRNPGGTFEIPCDINGLALQMIFDTGASDVTISSVEANFMFKNGYLSEKDVKGKKYYQIADGQLSEGTTVTLREIKIGDAVLHNVDASVVKSQKAPLLLGQSAMERFGTITIDNKSNKLIIRH